jgi:hypothetical protein
LYLFDELLELVLVEELVLVFDVEELKNKSANCIIGSEVGGV